MKFLKLFSDQNVMRLLKYSYYLRIKSAGLVKFKSTIMNQPNVVNLSSQEVAGDEGHELMVVVNYRWLLYMLSCEWFLKVQDVQWIY